MKPSQLLNLILCKSFFATNLKGAWSWITTRRGTTIAFFVFAVLLYFPGIWWGLPYATAPDRIHAWGSDELAPLGPVAELYNVFVVRQPPFNPQYPLFQYVMQSLLIGPYLIYLWFTGGFFQPSPEYPFGLVSPVFSLQIMTILGRMVSLFMAAGVVVVSYKTASVLWNQTAGLVAGVFVLLMYPMFYYSRTSNVDMGALFWTSLGLLVFARSLKDTLTPGRAAWLGVLAALATATKDASYAAFIMMGLVLVPKHLYLAWRTGIGWRQTLRTPLVGAFSGLIVYAAASGLLFHAGRYWSHIEFITQIGNELKYIIASHTTPTSLSYLGLIGDIVSHTVNALSIPAAILALVGLGSCLYRTPETLLFVLPAVGVAVGVILPSGFVMFRFVIIIAYVFALFAACGTVEITKHFPRPMFHRIAQLILVLIWGWMLLRGSDLTYQMINDSRYDMAAWFRQFAQTGDRVGYYGDPLKLPHLESGIVTVPMSGQLASSLPSQQQSIQPEFVVIIPQQEFEAVHEWTLPEDIYYALLDGSIGYKQVWESQTGSLFSKRTISFVNPPVMVFARKDRLAEISGIHVDVSDDR